MPVGKARSYLLVLGTFVLIVASCGGGVSGEVLDGGLLYDKWWSTADLDEPSGDQALWATQTTNERMGADTFRCKECHGWDYKGVDGAYGSGSHMTGFPGILASADKSTDELTTALTSGDHDFSALSDESIAALVEFMQEALVDVGQFINSDDKTVSGGDTDHGEDLYARTCASCHGADGLLRNFGSDEEPEHIGGLARGNPWEFFHKARFGHPGSDPVMPSTLDLGWSLEDVRDVVQYAQTLAD